MKVAIFSPYATVAPHFETELEIAQRHYDLNDSVEYVACQGELSNCDFNRTRDPQSCQECIGRRKHGLSLLSATTRPIAFPNAALTVKVPEFPTVESLIEHSVENFDIGYAVLSSLVSHCRDPEPDLVEHRKMIVAFYQSAMVAYRFTQRYIAHKSPDRIYVFNGRFAAMRAILRACESKNVECFIHERGCDLFHFDFFENHLPHEIEGINRAINLAWDQAEPAKREKIGGSWFHDRVNRVERNWTSFVKNQQLGKLPANWDASKHNVTIFCSSDDEFVAIGDNWKNKLYENQLDAIERIASEVSGDGSIQLYLRMHPNLANTENATKQKMLELDFPNLKVITPTDPCDTYHLMRSSNSVVSFGSSVGIEAVYWEKPSILLGPCLYQHLKGCYQPESHRIAIELIQDKNLKPQTRSGAIKYGYWFQTHGIKFRYFEPESLFHGKFKGQVVYAKPIKRTIPQMFRFRAGKFIKALVNKPDQKSRGSAEDRAA